MLRALLTDCARPIKPSKGVESLEKSTLSWVATPKVWVLRARPATLISSVTMSPATFPEPYVTWNGAAVSTKLEDDCGPKKVC